jgi:hypothetical protein
MAEFQTVMAQAARMCNSHKSCASCPIKKNCVTSCRKFIFDHPDEFEEIIMKWAAEHPFKSNGTKFLDVFGVPFWAISCGVTPAISKWLRSEYKEPEK